MDGHDISRQELDWVDFRKLDWVQAHAALGEEVRTQAQQVLARRLAALSEDAYNGAICQSRRIYQALLTKSRDARLDARLRTAVLEYLDCLHAWSSGAGLLEQSFANVNRQYVDDLNVTGLELGIFMQDEYSGCQTGLIREPDGSVTLFHTEEDAEEYPGSRFDRLRIAQFVLPGMKPVEVCSFIYPDLLPGSAFNWRSDGYVQAVDALFLRAGACSGPMLANAAAWAAVRLGGVLPPQQVVQQLSPFLDGYGLLAAWKQPDKIEAARIEFAGETVLAVDLPKAAGSFLFQVNLFSERQARITQDYENFELATHAAYLQRQQRGSAALAAFSRDNLVSLLCSTEGDDYGFSNPDVKAHWIAHLDGHQLQIQVAAGPAAPGDVAQTLDYFLG